MWLYGASGHGKVIKDILEAQGRKVDGFIDDNPNNVAAASALGITGILFEGKEKLEDVIHRIASQEIF